MAAKRRAVLITRPEPGASQTREAVAALGFEPILAPALAIGRLRRLTVGDVEGAQAAVLTSAAAAEAAAQDLTPLQLSGLSAFCVGERTGDAARRAGFGRVEVGAGRAAELPALLEAVEPARGAILILRGREVAEPLAPPLTAQGFETRDLALYGADPAAALPEAALAALDQDKIAAVLMLSARTAESFQTLVLSSGRAGALAEAVAACNSARTAAPARDSGLWGRVLEAKTPTLAATLALLHGL